MTREDAFAWIMPKSQQIDSSASRHGVPPELVAGILAVEIDNDLDETDITTDAGAMLCIELMKSPIAAAAMGCVCQSYLELYSNVGLGVGLAQIHINREDYDWWAAVNHYREQGYHLPAWADDPVEALLYPPGAIEGAAVYARTLADARTGVNASHTNDLSINDMGLIFIAYRGGIAGLTAPAGDEAAFESVIDFQASTHNASNSQNGQISMPYFDAFQFYFDNIDLYEAEYPEWRSQ